MTDAPATFADLCSDLADLHGRLGDELWPDAPAVPDRSNQMRSALLWCAAHEAGHRRDEWESGVCAPGSDPRRASVYIAPTLAKTPPRWSQTRRAYGPSSPADDGVLSVRSDIESDVLGLAQYAREALNHTTVDHDTAGALKALPGLLAALGVGHPLCRRAQWLLPALRRRARLVLEMDRPPLTLAAECPTTRDEYAATWVPKQVGESWIWVAGAVWDDGVCRTYDTEASRPDAEPPVDVWKRSSLYVRDPSAGRGSDDGSIRCAGCRRVWRTDEEVRRLGRLLRDDGSPDPAASVRMLLYGRLADSMRVVADRWAADVC